MLWSVGDSSEARYCSPNHCVSARLVPGMEQGGTAAEGVHLCKERTHPGHQGGISMYRMKPGNPLEDFITVVICSGA